MVSAATRLDLPVLTPNPRVVFMGTPRFAVSALEALIRADHEVAVVVTQPDRPRGRGRSPAASPVKQAAEEAGLVVWQPERVSAPGLVARLKAVAPDLVVVVAFGQMLAQAVLDVPRWGAINIHASLLPKYRGPAPIQRAIMDNAPETGLTAMKMEAGLDTGPILLQWRTPVGEEETAGQLHDRLAARSGPFLLQTLAGLSQRRLSLQLQDERLATYAPKIDRKEAEVDWARPAWELSGVIRALDPWPGAFTRLGERPFKVFLPFRDQSERHGRRVPGWIVDVNERRMLVETGEGRLAIRECQLPGRRRMVVAEFARGFPLKPGMRLGGRGNTRSLA